MPIWKRFTLAAALCAAGQASAMSGADDFARGEKVELIASSAALRITAPFVDQRRAVGSASPICIDKAADSFDVDIPFDSFGLPVSVRFTGTRVDATHVRLTADQRIDQCVSIEGSNRFVKRVTGSVTLNLSSFEFPTAGTCVSDFAANAQVDASAADNRLHFTVDSGCGGVTVNADVVVSDLVIDALVGKHAPPLPIIVDRFQLERSYICPSPTEPTRVPGWLTLRHLAPFSGVNFGLSSDTPGVNPSPATLRVEPRRSRGTFSTTVPAGFVGTVNFTARDFISGATANTSLTVSNGLPALGGRCRIPKLLLLAKNNLLGVCLACGFRGPIRQGRPAGTIARNQWGSAFQSAASLAGAAGWSTLSGKLEGQLFDAKGALQTLADVRFTDMNDVGAAAGTYVDPVKQTHAPVLWVAGALKSLPSPSGYGEAEFISNQGHVGGWVLDGKNTMQAALWRNGALRTLHPQSAVSSRVVSVSNDGLAVVQAFDAKGRPFALTHDIAKNLTTLVATPAGFDGVELVGATREGLRAGHLVKNGVRTPFIDFGVGVQPLSQLQSQGWTVTELLALSDDGDLLATATLNGKSSTQLFNVK